MASSAMTPYGSDVGPEPVAASTAGGGTRDRDEKVRRGRRAKMRDLARQWNGQMVAGRVHACESCGPALLLLTNIRKRKERVSMVCVKAMRRRTLDMKVSVENYGQVLPRRGTRSGGVVDKKSRSPMDLGSWRSRT